VKVLAARKGMCLPTLSDLQAAASTLELYDFLPHHSKRRFIMRSVQPALSVSLLASKNRARLGGAHYCGGSLN